MTESESLQAAIHEAVALQPYDPAWPAAAQAEVARLMALFAPQLIEVQHFGSTAVPGLPAKPVLDLLAGVASMAQADALGALLLGVGYTTSAAFNATLTDRRWFMRWADGRRTHHLHVVVWGGPEWQRRLRFRDLLLASPALAQRYATLKTTLAAQHPTDREAYTEGKSVFVLAALAA